MEARSITWLPPRAALVLAVSLAGLLAALVWLSASSQAAASGRPHAAWLGLPSAQGSHLLGRLPGPSNFTCVGEDPSTACAASWACMDVSDPSRIYAAGVPAAGLNTTLRPRWEAEGPWRLARLHLLPLSRLASAVPASTPVRLLPGTTLLSKRYAVGNFGHLLTESVLPAIKGAQAVEPGFSLHRLRWLLLDDCSSTADYELWWGYEPREESCSTRFAQLLSALEPTASAAEWRALVVAEQSPGLACFERAFFGSGMRSGLVIPFTHQCLPYPAPADQLRAWELFASHWRQQVGRFRQPPAAATNLTARLPPAGRRARPLRVLVHQKDRRNRHGGALLNGDALCAALLGRAASRASLVCDVVSLDDHPHLPEQLSMFASADVYVSDGGSAMYYAALLPPGALFLTYERCFPLSTPAACDGKAASNAACHSECIGVVRALPHITARMLPLNDHAQQLSWFTGTWLHPFGGRDTNCGSNPGGYRAFDVNLPVELTIQAIANGTGLALHS